MQRSRTRQLQSYSSLTSAESTTVGDEVFKKLVRFPTCDFLFFLSSSTLNRFREHSAIKQKIVRRMTTITSIAPRFLTIESAPERPSAIIWLRSLSRKDPMSMVSFSDRRTHLVWTSFCELLGYKTSSMAKLILISIERTSSLNQERLQLDDFLQKC